MHHVSLTTNVSYTITNRYRIIIFVALMSRHDHIESTLTLTLTLTLTTTTTTTTTSVSLCFFLSLYTILTVETLQLDPSALRLNHIQIK